MCINLHIDCGINFILDTLRGLMLRLRLTLEVTSNAQVSDIVDVGGDCVGRSDPFDR